jgi:hypothetical protein
MNNTIFSHLHPSSNYCFIALIIEKSQSWCNSFPQWLFLENWNNDLVAYEEWMGDDLQLVKKIEGAHVCHAFLTPPPAATADRISILFFRATAAV